METKQWKPKNGERYYMIINYQFLRFIVASDVYTGCPLDRNLMKDGNMFSTKAEAQAKLRQIKKILKER